VPGCFALGGPVLIVIDDLQWIDRASEGALAFALRRITEEPVGLLLARRIALTTDLTRAVPDDRDFGSSLASAIDRQLRIDVGGLTVGALGRLLHERLGVALPRPLLVRVHAACHGNPFLALEVSRSVLARNAEPGPGEPFPVPPEAGPLVRDHLATLTAAARRSVVLVAMSPDPRLDLIARGSRRPRRTGSRRGLRQGNSGRRGRSTPSCPSPLRLDGVRRRAARRTARATAGTGRPRQGSGRAGDSSRCHGRRPG
jgi:hypothetical protein